MTGGNCAFYGYVSDGGGCQDGKDGAFIAAFNGTINLQEFGADPTDTNAIDTALSNWTAYLSAHGGKGYIDTGTYKVTTPDITITIPSSSLTDQRKVTLDGAGRGAAQFDWEGTGTSANAVLTINGCPADGNVNLSTGNFGLIGHAFDVVGLRINCAAWSHLHDFIAQGFEEGFQGQSVISSKISDSMLYGNTIGWHLLRGTPNMFRPNSIQIDNVETADNTGWGAIVEEPNLINFRGGNFEGNGSQSTVGGNAGDLEIINPGHGGVSSQCVNVHGTHFENTTGIANVEINMGANNCVVSIDNNSLDRIDSIKHVLYPIYVVQSSSSGFLNLEMKANAFHNANSYVPSTAEPYWAFSDYSAGAAARRSVEVLSEQQYDSPIAMPYEPTAPEANSILLNGSFNLASAGPGPYTVSGLLSYPIDHWLIQRSNGGTVCAAQTIDGTSFQHGLSFGRCPSDTGTLATQLWQPLLTEDSLPLAGKIVSCSGYYMTGANYSGTGVNLILETGTGDNQTNVNAITGIAPAISVTLPAVSSWTFFQRFSIPIPSNVTQLFFLMSTGTMSGTAGSDDNVDVKELKCEPGTTATGYLQRPHESLLAYVDQGALSERMMFQTASPKFIIAPTGTIGNNGALTLGTALPYVPANAYLWLPANAISSGSAQGWYFAQFSSTTAGSVYNNTYTYGQVPAVPSPLVPFVTTNSTGYTGVTTEVQGPTYAMPANTMGPHSTLKVTTLYTMPKNADNKTLRTAITATNFYADVQAGSTIAAQGTTVLITDEGSTALQIGCPGASGNAAGCAGASTQPYSTGTVDMTQTQNVYATGTMGTATDYLIFESFSVELLNSP